MVPCVVAAVKFGASSLMRSDILNPHLGLDAGLLARPWCFLAAAQYMFFYCAQTQLQS
jgi:hypothetical protein